MGKVQVQWMKGESGTGGTYTFNPKPSLVRNSPSQRKAVLEIPLLDGAVIQTLGSAVRMIELQGIISVYPPNFDNLVQAKSGFESYINSGIGQLHIISGYGQSNSKHIYYKGILDGDIQWGEQNNMEFLDYRFAIICADPTEYEYIAPP